MRVLVCGGRDFHDPGMVERSLNQLNGQRAITCIIHGNARGADQLGKYWALRHGVKHEPYPADWNKYPRGAGPIRNRQMLSEACPEYVVAFPGGKGTADMVQISKDAGLPVWVL